GQAIVLYRSDQRDAIAQSCTSHVLVERASERTLTDDETAVVQPAPRELRARVDQGVQAFDGNEVADEEDDPLIAVDPQLRTRRVTRSGMKPRRFHAV